MTQNQYNSELAQLEQASSMLLAPIEKELETQIKEEKKVQERLMYYIKQNALLKNTVARLKKELRLRKRAQRVLKVEFLATHHVDEVAE